MAAMTARATSFLTSTRASAAPSASLDFMLAPAFVGLCSFRSVQWVAAAPPLPLPQRVSDELDVQRALGVPRLSQQSEVVAVIAQVADRPRLVVRDGLRRLIR